LTANNFVTTIATNENRGTQQEFSVSIKVSKESVGILTLKSDVKDDSIGLRSRIRKNKIRLPAFLEIPLWLHPKTYNSFQLRVRNSVHTRKWQFQTCFNVKRIMLLFLLLMLLFHSVCNQVSSQADKLVLLAIFIISRCFAHLNRCANHRLIIKIARRTNLSACKMNCLQRISHNDYTVVSCIPLGAKRIVNKFSSDFSCPNCKWNYTLHASRLKVCIVVILNIDDFYYPDNGYFLTFVFKLTG